MNSSVSSRLTHAFVCWLLCALWVSGAVAQPNVQGKWSTLSNTMPINPVHVALLSNGNVLVVAGSGSCPPSLSGCPSGPPYGPSNGSGALLVNPVSGQIIAQFSLSWDMFCNGMVLLADGRAFIDGGTIQYDPFYGQPQVAIFDPATNTFGNVQSMAHGRWYPTVLTLGDGSVMAFSGLDETGSGNNAGGVEFYTVGSGWSAEFFGPWIPDVYPRLHLLPSGEVFYSGAQTTSKLFDPSTITWNTNVANTNYSEVRTYGTSVLLPLTPANNYDPKVIIMGGGNPATNTTEIIDMGASTPGWQYGPNMSEARVELNAVILPNGKVLALGGSVNDEDMATLSLNADLYDPASNTFSSAGANASQRLYHSVALLVPDGTVWVAGGNPQRGTYNNTMEIYQPPYLFNADGTTATRPSITSAPSSISYGNSFSVTTPDAANISSVVLVRNGTVTHAFGMDQREVGLSFTAGSGTLTVTAPPNGNIAPPGYYMLFLLNNSGVPSMAAFVQLMGSTGVFAPIRVNAGGPNYVDSLGQTWSADSGFNGGMTASTSNTISNTNDPTLYQTVRYGLGPSSFDYTFRVPNGNYNVVLKFAEIYWTGVGQREFNVGINGTQVLTNFDVVAAAAGAFKAIDKTFPVSATNGTITVQFSPGAADNPLVNAIQVLSASGVGVRVSPNPLVFGNVQINTTAGPNTVTLSNIGSGTVSISTIGSPTNAAYVVSNNNCNGANLTMNTCTFQVSFTPTAAQSYPATIAINDSFGDSLTLSGAGVNSQCPGAVVVGIYTKCGQTYANAGATTISANYTPASTDNGIIVKLSWCIVSNCASSMAGVTATLTGNVSLTGFCFASPSSPFITNANGGAQGSGDFEEHYIWYCPTTPVGLTSFTGTPSSGVSSPISIDVSEWQGLSTSCPACFDVDASAVAGATQGTNASVPLTTTNANDLIYAGFEIPFNANQTGSPGSGFTAITMCTSIGCPAPAGNNPGWATEAKGVTSAGSNPANITYSIAGNWFGVAAAIKSAASLSAPTNLAATAGNGQVGLSWSASSGATSYNVKRSTTSGGPYTTIASPTTSSYTDTGVTNGTTYYYVVSAVNTAGQSANSGQVSATPQPAVPATPTNLAATAGNGQVGLSWSASSGATSYNVKRSTTSGGPYTTIASPTTSSYTDTGVTNGTTYYYVVSAVNTAGESSNSSQVSATPQVGVAPAPTNVTGTGGNGQVVLSWSASSGARSYNVKRSTTSGGPYTTIASPTTSSYTDTGVTNGTTYYYVVSAVNTAGQSANSG